ncbi:ketose-bisphosphate aldolase [Candidatus Poribacteria bacterium]|nr:ketose-bisphosphate aldolase [Candidatus Poribacteria bacterium]
MLVPSKELVQDAKAGGYAVGAFNAVNMETAQAIFAAAERENSPLIIQVTQTTMAYTEPEDVAAVIFNLAERSSIPVAVHLDHGRSFGVIMRFLKMGFSSVMIDGSLQEDGKTPRTYEENVAVTKQVIEAAHSLGVSVEAEIGRLGQIGQDSGVALTDPDEAAKFVEDIKFDGKTVDMLAVAIGTRHGLFKGKPIIRSDRVKELADKLDMPLVMHGGTGVPDEDVQKGIEAGICKVNIDTQIRVAFYDRLLEVVTEKEKEYAEADAAGEPRKYDIRKIIAPTRDAMTDAIAEKMRLFGSAGKA